MLRPVTALSFFVIATAAGCGGNSKHSTAASPAQRAQIVAGLHTAITLGCNGAPALICVGPLTYSSIRVSRSDPEYALVTMRGQANHVFLALMHRRNGRWLIRDYAPSGIDGIGCVGTSSRLRRDLEISCPK
jgi:hypothetical protein